MRASYEMVVKPLPVPKANGRFRQQAAGSGVDDDPHQENEQGKKKVGPHATATDGSQAAPIRGRLRPLRRILRGGQGIEGRLIHPTQ